MLYFFIKRINRRKSRYLKDKEQDQQEGEEYRRLAEKSELEQKELSNVKKSKQKDVRNMFDKAVEDRRKVKEMEQQMDEVICHKNEFFLNIPFF